MNSFFFSFFLSPFQSVHLRSANLSFGTPNPEVGGGVTVTKLVTPPPDILAAGMKLVIGELVRSPQI